MRSFLAVAILCSVALVSGCGSAGSDAPAPVRVYRGSVAPGNCASDWFTGVDATARYVCGKGGYLIEFLRTGETGSVSGVKPTSHMFIDAVVQTSARTGSGAVANPGVVCYVDTKHGWLARLGVDSAYDLVPLGSADTLAKGTSKVVLPLGRRNRIRLTCDATGSRTLLSLSVNGRVVVRSVDAGGAAPLVAFGVTGVGQIGSIVALRDITTTTGVVAQ